MGYDYSTISNVALDLNGGAEAEIGDGVKRVMIGWKDLMEHLIAICQGAVIQDCRPGPPPLNIRASELSPPQGLILVICACSAVNVDKTCPARSRLIERI
jgi:hypothetical protein